MSIIARNLSDSNPNAFAPLKPLEARKRPAKVVRPRLPRPRRRPRSAYASPARWPAWTDAESWTTEPRAFAGLDAAPAGKFWRQVTDRAWVLADGDPAGLVADINPDSVGVDPPVEPEPIAPDVYRPDAVEAAWWLGYELVMSDVEGELDGMATEPDVLHAFARGEAAGWREREARDAAAFAVPAEIHPNEVIEAIGAVEARKQAKQTA